MWPTARLVIFVLATGALAIASRRALIQPRAHGFVRFFVFEGILALLLLNAPVWFINPLRWHQLTSWVLLVSSLPPLVLGAREMTAKGQADRGRRAEPGLYGFESTTRLVCSGIFRYVRHPLYSSLLLLIWGVWFKLPSVTGVAIAVPASAGIMMMAHLDEAECVRFFGREYTEYMERTKRFVPFVV